MATCDEWPYFVRAYYGPGGRAGTRNNPNRGRVGELEGDLSVEVGCKSKSVADTEVLAAKARDDIATITVSGPDGSEAYYRTSEGWSR